MRLLFGIVLGAILTVGGAYLYDSHRATSAGTTGTQANLEKPLVNWDEVARSWDLLTARARAEWNKLRADTRPT